MNNERCLEWFERSTIEKKNPIACMLSVLLCSNSTLIACQASEVSELLAAQ